MRLEEFAALPLFACRVPAFLGKKLSWPDTQVRKGTAVLLAQRSSKRIWDVGRQLTFVLFLVLLCCGCSTAHSSLQITEIAPGVFDGPKPRSQSDFQALREKGIRTIVSLQTLTGDIEPERKRAAKNGFEYVNVPILASPFGPREEKVRQLFEAIAAPSARPVYVHCLLGRDRTGVLMALYRVYYENVSPKDAWEEMIHRGGFRSRWALIGFRVYYWNHCDRPDWVRPSVNSLTAALPRN
jgi:protein-tyrosine phosphatase